MPQIMEKVQMTFSNAILVSIFLGAGLVTGCASADVQEPDADDVSLEDLRSGKTVQLTEADDGTIVHIEQGQTLVLKLNANATTGYSWKLTSISRALGQPVMNYKVNGLQTGASGVASFTWKTQTTLDLSGSHKVALAYQRGNGDPAKTYAFTVNIVKPGSAIVRGEGSMCGGFANLKCDTGLQCVFGKPPAGAAADMSGKCHKN
jgi:predicted secreted protein